MSREYPKVSITENFIFILTLVVLVIFVFGVSSHGCHPTEPKPVPKYKFVL